VAPGLMHQQGAEIIQVIARILGFFMHCVARDGRDSTGNHPLRISLGMRIDGGGGYSTFHTAYQENDRNKYRDSLRGVGSRSRRPINCGNSDTFN
jgi:hypothetical protein